VAQRQRLEREPNERQLQRLVELEAEQNRAAEALIGRYPVIAEVLETRPADMERLQVGLPAGTVVLQPVVLTGVPKRPDSLAMFVLTRNSLQLVSVPLPPKFTALVEAYRQELEQNDPYLERSQRLYDLLIGPVEAKGWLPAGSRLALITTGVLLDIPLETLFDGRSQQYLIEKFPIHYLTRLSRTGPVGSGTRQAPGGASLPKAGGARHALVLANPKPNAKPIPGTETEANFLLRAYPGSLDLRGEQATLARFQQQANRFPILHLGTHGCFLPAGCPDLAMKPNTLLFANGVQYPIAQAAELGLSNTELLVLAACQTARITTDSDVGVSGLAYVWERAGARAVVASLWNADDQKSSQLIPAFYTNLQAGMDKADAMRQAKLQLIRNDADLHPSRWAPFIVIGDASPLGQ
jgi:CHAT domain-containing protein